MTWFSKIVKKDAIKAQGTDGSGEYTRHKNARFIIGQTATGAVVSFKPFLTSFGMKFESEELDRTKDYQGLEQRKVYKTTSVYISYEISLELVSHSINEAEINIQRINEMGQMFHSVFPTTGERDMPKDVRNSYFVSFSNIISSQYNPKATINSFDDLVTQGVPCFIESFDVTVDKEMGYFEQGLDLIPKKHTISFTLKVSNGTYDSINAKYLWLPMYDDGNYYDRDIKVFPFGISSNKSPIGKDGSNMFSGNKNAYIYIAKQAIKDDEGNIIAQAPNSLIGFKPFITDLKFNHSHTVPVTQLEDRGGSYQLQHDSTINVQQKVTLAFSVISHSVNEASNNMRKLQTLLRILDTYAPFEANSGAVFWENPKTGAANIYLAISDLTSVDSRIVSSFDDLVESAKEYTVEGLTFNFDLEMGMLEHEGMLYFKKFDISMDLKMLDLGDINYVEINPFDGYKGSPKQSEDSLPFNIYSNWRF